MIELLGVGVPGGGGQWLLRGGCARIETGQLTTVVARMPAQSAALLDAVAGRLIPREGRVWVNRRPLMREMAGRVRATVADVGRATSFAPDRSVLWNTLVAGGHSLAGLLRFPMTSLDVVALFEAHGGQLDDESVTQLEHALQCAHHGAELLRPYVPARVAWLAEYHVVAKRYLCAVDPRYAARLSPASARTLALQGAALPIEDRLALETRPWFVDAVRIRRWDDEAKVPGAVVPPLDEYRPLRERWLGPQSPCGSGAARA